MVKLCVLFGRSFEYIKSQVRTITSRTDSNQNDCQFLVSQVIPNIIMATHINLNVSNLTWCSDDILKCLKLANIV